MVVLQRNNNTCQKYPIHNQLKLEKYLLHISKKLKRKHDQGCTTVTLSKYILQKPTDNSHLHLLGTRMSLHLAPMELPGSSAHTFGTGFIIEPSCTMIDWQQKRKENLRHYKPNITNTGNLKSSDETSIMYDTGFFHQKFKLISTAEFKYLRRRRRNHGGHIRRSIWWNEERQF